MKTAIHHYIFKEGIGGGDTPSFLLLLNGGICKSWSKGNWSLIQARMGADVHVNQWIANLGADHVTFTDETRETVTELIGDILTGVEALEARAETVNRALSKAPANELQDERIKQNGIRHTQVRDRLEALGYVRISSHTSAENPHNEIKTFATYVRHTDGQKVIIATRSSRRFELLEVDVYSEVSRSTNWEEYFTAIT